MPEVATVNDTVDATPAVCETGCVVTSGEAGGGLTVRVAALLVALLTLLVTTQS